MSIKNTVWYAISSVEVCTCANWHSVYTLEITLFTKIGITKANDSQQYTIPKHSQPKYCQHFLLVFVRLREFAFASDFRNHTSKNYPVQNILF